MARIPAATPANYGLVTMPRVYNLQYPGDVLIATSTQSSATTYNVRDFTGTIISSGAWTGTTTTIGTAGTAPFDKLGWYTLQLFGPDRVDGTWTTDYGTCRFVIGATNALIPSAPTRASAPAGVTNGLEAPLAHGVFSLGSTRVALLAGQIAYYTSSDGFLASGTSLTVTNTGGGFGGNTNAAQTVFVVHTVVGDATGMAASAGYTLVGTSINTNITMKVYRQYGAQNPGTVTVTTTNAAQHSVDMFVVQWVDGNATLGGQILVTPISGTGTSAVFNADLTTLAPGATEYSLTTAIATASSNVRPSSVTGGLSPTQGIGNQQLTHDIFGGGQVSTETYNYAVSQVWVGMTFAFKAFANYAANLVTAKSKMADANTYWAQNSTTNRPRQITMQMLSDTTSNAVGRHGAALTQIVTDTFSYIPGLVSGYTGRNEPQGNYNAAESLAFANAVHAVAGAKAFGPDYVNFPLGTDLGAQIDAGIYNNLDAMSFHCYNMGSGDLYGCVLPTIEAMRDILAVRGKSSLPIWMTEGGHDTTWYSGNLRVHSAGQSNMLLNMAFEIILKMQYEKVFYYYDNRAGFDQVTTWSASDSGPYPGWAMHRAYAIELQNKTITSRLDFGDANFLYLGGLWTDVNGSTVMAIIGASKGVPALSCYASGLVTVLDCWGNIIATPTGAFTLTIGSTAMFIRAAVGINIGIKPPLFGRNLLGNSYQPVGSDTGETQPGTSMAKLTDLSRTSCYAYSSGDNSSTGQGSTYTTTTNSFPRTISVTTPLWNNQSDTIIVTCGYPWQGISALMDFDIQTLTGATWTTRATFTQVGLGVKNYDLSSDTMVDSYTDPQHVFVAAVPGGTIVAGVRLVIRAASLQMHLDALSNQPPGIASPSGNTQTVNIRSIEAYNSNAAMISPIL